MSFVDLRDRYGVTQLVFSEKLADEVESIGREYVISITGIVLERSNKNKEIFTGDIEIEVNNFEVLSKSEIPPFTIEE